MSSEPWQPAALPSGTATVDHTRDHEDLAALYALGVLEGDERALFERHLVRCGRCHQVVAGDRLAVAALGAGAPEMEPSPDFKARLMARAEQELAEASRSVPSPVHGPVAESRASRGFRPRRDWGAWLLPVAALFLAIIAGAAALGQQIAGSQVVTVRPLEGAAGTGTATVVVRRSGDATIQLNELGALPPGGVYQAWLIGPDGVPAPAGASISGSGTIPIEGDPRGKTVAITVEPRPGARAPSSTPILAAQVPA